LAQKHGEQVRPAKKPTLRVARRPRAFVINTDHNAMAVARYQHACILLALDRADDDTSAIANDLTRRSLLNYDDGSIHQAASWP
jgi:hypothetical protein